MLSLMRCTFLIHQIEVCLTGYIMMLQAFLCLKL
ncbi:hypothetical protein LINGRAHAP2_LOCUS36773 [Linum grandiflorum]